MIQTVGQMWSENFFFLLIFRKWLRKTKNYAPDNVKKIVVGNKCDLEIKYSFIYRIQ